MVFQTCEFKYFWKLLVISSGLVSLFCMSHFLVAVRPTKSVQVILILVVCDSVFESGSSWFSGTTCTFFALVSFKVAFKDHFTGVNGAFYNRAGSSFQATLLSRDKTII